MSFDRFTSPKNGTHSPCLRRGGGNRTCSPFRVRDLRVVLPFACLIPWAPFCVSCKIGNVLLLLLYNLFLDFKIRITFDFSPYPNVSVRPDFWPLGKYKRQPHCGQRVPLGSVQIFFIILAWLRGCPNLFPFCSECLFFSSMKIVGLASTETISTKPFWQNVYSLRI